jgi:integrase
MEKGSNRVAMHRYKTNYVGVYERISKERRHNGKHDICYDITFVSDRKKIWEKVGWASEGYTAKLAYQIRSTRLYMIRHGEELPKEKKKAPFFRDIAAKYLEWAKDNRARRGQDDHCHYKNYLAPRFDAKRLDNIGPFELEKLKSDLLKKGLAPGTVKHCLVVFRQIINKAIQWNLFTGNNPIKGVKLPIVQNQRERFLTYEDADLLLVELDKTSKQLHDMALLSLHCGLRANEIFCLKGQDLDFNNDLINIADSKNKESRKAFMTESVKKMLASRIPGSPDGVREIAKEEFVQNRLDDYEGDIEEDIKKILLMDKRREKGQLEKKNLEHKHKVRLDVLYLNKVGDRLIFDERKRGGLGSLDNLQ